MIILLLVFWETYIMFSTGVAPIYNPTNSVWGFPFLYPHPCQHLLFCYFDDSHSDRCKVYFIVVLICISLMISNVEHLFLCLLAIWISSLKKMSVLSCPFFNWVVWVFWCLVVWVVYICWILTPYRAYHLQIYSPIQSTGFFCLFVFSCSAKANFNYVSFV